MFLVDILTILDSDMFSLEKKLLIGIQYQPLSGCHRLSLAKDEQGEKLILRTGTTELIIMRNTAEVLSRQISSQVLHSVLKSTFLEKKTRIPSWMKPPYIYIYLWWTNVLFSPSTSPFFHSNKTGMDKYGFEYLRADG